MSEMGDMWRDIKEKQRQTKHHNLKANTEYLTFAAGYLGFELKMHTEHHFSLFHPKKGRMDYWPSTKKAVWFVNKKPTKLFHIKDIETYIEEHFQQ